MSRIYGKTIIIFLLVATITVALALIIYKPLPEQSVYLLCPVKEGKVLFRYDAKTAEWTRLFNGRFFETMHILPNDSGIILVEEIAEDVTQITLWRGDENEQFLFGDDVYSRFHPGHEPEISPDGRIFATFTYERGQNRKINRLTYLDDCTKTGCRTVKNHVLPLWSPSGKQALLESWGGIATSKPTAMNLEFNEGVYLGNHDGIPQYQINSEHQFVMTWLTEETYIYKAFDYHSQPENTPESEQSGTQNEHHDIQGNHQPKDDLQFIEPTPTKEISITPITYSRSLSGANAKLMWANLQGDKQFLSDGQTLWGSQEPTSFDHLLIFQAYPNPIDSDELFVLLNGDFHDNEEFTHTGIERLVSLQISTGKVTQILELEEYMDVRFTPNGRWMSITNLRKPIVYLFNLETKEMYPYTFDVWPYDVDWSGDSRWLVAVNNQMLLFSPVTKRSHYISLPEEVTKTSELGLCRTFGWGP